MQTHSLPTTPLASSSKTPISSTTTKRPKALTKKNSVSTRDKRQDVQINLEAKVEKSKGFHAFFVPLGRGIPAAPPSSPVLGAQRDRDQGEVGKDYFEDWVEDVRGRGSGSGCSESSGGEGMDLD